MPHPDAITAKGRAFIDALPVRVREDPDIVAVQHCYGKEAELLDVAREGLVANAFPEHADEAGLAWWEWLLGTTVAPVGLTVEQRRATVVAFEEALRTSGSGRWWEETLERIVGPGFDYREYHPDGQPPPPGGGTPPSNPPPGTIIIELPFPPSAGLYAATETLIRRITDAHIDIVLTSGDGFVLDQSQLDQEPLNW